MENVTVHIFNCYLLEQRGVIVIWLSVRVLNFNVAV